MEEDALRLVQCNGHFSKADGSGFDQSDQEVRESRTDTQLLSFLGFANYYREFIKRYADKVYPMQKLMRNKGKKIEWNDEAEVAFENIKRELCEAPVLGMPTEKGTYVLDTDASVVAISGKLYQEQE